MIKLLQGFQRSNNSDLFATMFRHRKTVFRDQKKWDVNIVDGEFEIAGFEIDAGLPGVEPFPLALDGDSVVREWRLEIVDDGVRRVGRGDGGGVFRVMSLADSFD